MSVISIFAHQKSLVQMLESQEELLLELLLILGLENTNRQIRKTKSPPVKGKAACFFVFFLGCKLTLSLFQRPKGNC